MAQDTYEYDVFISYRRKKLVQPWVRHFFGQVFKEYLDQALPERDVQVFLDEEIETGEEWPESIREGLRRSRCLVPILNSQYFYSPWCLAEWESFKRRSEITDSALILPVRLQNCEGKTDIKWDDFERWRFYRIDLEKLDDWKPRGEFEQQVDRFASRVAQIIKTAPPFDPGWEVVQPSDIPQTARPRISRPQM